MSTSRWFNKVCAVAVALALLLTVLLMGGAASGIQTVSRTVGYENRLFDTSVVHRIDLVLDDWDGFLEDCENEQYTDCAVVIDGESVRHAGLRAKGNTSLSNVRQSGSSRYSLKIEFDHYQTGNTYHGLDKLCLNNLIQDNTMMKDYLAYRMMADFGAEAPLCSYAFVTVNGEDWGLFLAVEGLEDSFLQRVYGSETGDLYKPDSMNFGGGRGNGRDFKMSEFDFSQFGPRRPGAENDGSSSETAAPGSSDTGFPPFSGESLGSSDSGFPPFSAEFGSSDSGFPPFSVEFGSSETGFPDFSMDGQFPGFPMDLGSSENAPFGGGSSERGGGPGGGFPGGGPGGMGSTDVKLQYTDDDPDSYSNILNSAKTDVTDGDKARLIAALKTLHDAIENPGAENNLESALDMDEVLRYLVVHNFVVNGDSYTGSMIHNYYLHERDGKLSMIPWDYNLAYGTFQAGNASNAVNDPIDTPLSVNGDGDRPMADWVFSSEEYTALYHQYFAEFLSSLDLDSMITETAALIDEYVQRDPTKFCTYEQFQTGVETLKQFCQLRTESVSGQLAGTIPSTEEGQEADDSSLVATTGLTLSDLGSMGGGFGGKSGEGGGPGREGENRGGPFGSDSGFGSSESGGGFRGPGGRSNGPGGGFGGPGGDFGGGSGQSRRRG